MSAKAQIVGIDGIMDWYDQHCTSPYYAVYTYLAPTKLEKHFQYTKPDQDEGRMLLENTLQAMYMQNDETLYCIKLYDTLNKKNKNTTSSTYAGSIQDRIFIGADWPNALPSNTFLTVDANTSLFYNVVQIGSGTSTGTASQPLQVNGGAYVSGNLGVAHTNPTQKLDVVGNGNFTGIVTATTLSSGNVFVGTATSTGTFVT